ncbi:LPXTG cell wall anchor domain-containing protein [Lactococcus nasutitermitis]|uniref:LPXTG cell wall anchor domain-containing protein n=1 Tax=Lactococcus nasutitermitis TaxID=1652957 RepID=A0ABV9JCD6_9LACT|nr:LPXTG cell wall anchor domain-containing protein [Lactococcus nasutitermitis]
MGLGFKVQAQGQLGSTHTQELIIVKYGLNATSSSFSQEQTINTGEKINNLPVDNQGNELSPMGGIEYEIQKLSPTGDGDAIQLSNPSSYQTVGDVMTVVTGSDGIAQSVLQDGFYSVKEVANPSVHLSHPAATILLRLPVVNGSKDGYLDKVYIYPKSSIDPSHSKAVTPAKKVPQSENNKASVKKTVVKKGNNVLPKTGEMTSMSLGLLGAFIIFGALMTKKRKGESNESKANK